MVPSAAASRAGPSSAETTCAEITNTHQSGGSVCRGFPFNVYSVDVLYNGGDTEITTCIVAFDFVNIKTDSVEYIPACISNLPAGEDGQYTIEAARSDKYAPGSYKTGATFGGGPCSELNQHPHNFDECTQ